MTQKLAMSPATCVLLLLATASVGRAQQVYVVGSPAPGVFSQEIQPAVDAATNGDVILVENGSYYAGFTIDGKGVSVVAAVDALVITGSASIRNLATGQTVLLAGIWSGDGVGLSLQNNAGAIWIESCFLAGGTSDIMSFTGVSIVNCASVAIERCQIGGGWGPISGPLQDAAAGLEVANSNVAISDTTCRGGQGGQLHLQPVLSCAGGPGARIQSGSVFASGTTFRGGDGGFAFPIPGAAPGGDGIVTFGAVSVVQCTFTGGLSGAGSTSPPGQPTVIGGAGTLDSLSHSARHFAVTSLAREGQPIEVNASGIVGESLGTLFSTSPASPQLLASYDGSLLLSLANAGGLLLGDIGADGALSITLIAPSLPVTVQAATFYLQSIFFDAPLTHVVVGPASALVVIAL